MIIADWSNNVKKNLKKISSKKRDSMSKRKAPYKKKMFESDGSSADTSANIYESMLRSAAWCDLTAQQKTLYLCCKSQYYSEKRKPIPDDKETFTMNQAKWADVYKLYKRNNAKGFYRDMSELILHGFIVCIESGAYTRTKSIYKFSSMWVHWHTEEFHICKSDMSLTLLRQEDAGESDN